MTVPMRLRYAAALYSAALVILVATAIVRAPGGPWFETDLLALLPERLVESVPAPAEASLKKNLTEPQKRRVTVLFDADPSTGGNTKAAAQEAEERALAAFRASAIASGKLTSEPAPNASALVLPAAAGNLLSSADRDFLRDAVERHDVRALESRALSNLMNPAAPKLLGFAADPFGLYDAWLAERAAALPVRSRPCRLDRAASCTEAGGALLLTLSADEAAFSSGEGALQATLEAAKRAAHEAAPDVSIHAAGVPLFTDASATRTRTELTSIGTASTAGVLLLALFFFGRLATIGALAATVATGFAGALALTYLVFGAPALVTFVFGATLVGVAIDYGSHWFAAAPALADPVARRRAMAPGLIGAAASSAAAYSVLLATPLPGLRQMGFFAAAGLLVALGAVLFVLPALERCAPVKDGPLLAFLARRLPKLKPLGARPAGVRLAATLATALLLVPGLLMLERSDGVSDLRFAPPELLADQAALTRALALPSPAQVFVFRASNAEALAEAESAVAKDVRALGLEPLSVSDILPAPSVQAANRAIAAEAAALVAPRIEALLGAAPKPPADRPVTIEELAATPFGAVLSPLVLGENIRMMMLSGVGPEHLAPLAALARTTSDASVAFADLTGAMKHVLETYRDRILAAMATGMVLLFLCLTYVFGRDAWRALLPTVLGAAAALAACGWTGVPLTLFTSLGLVLLVGLGLDYGIFITLRPADGRTLAAVFFSCLTTLLAFGLLAFSETPALAAFGTTVAAGGAAVLLAAALLRKPAPADRSTQEAP